MSTIGPASRRLRRIPALALVCAVAGCALPRPQGPSPIYDFETVWFNGGVGDVRPWESGARLAAAEPVPGAEPAAEAKPTAKAPTRKKAARKAPAKKAAPTEQAAAQPAKKAAPAPRPRPPAARIAKVDPPAPEPPRRPVLGDGSIAGELVAAARRTIGMNADFGQRTWLAHLLTVIALDLGVTAPQAAYEGAVYAHLEDAGQTLQPGDELRPGDLLFFHWTSDRDGDGDTRDPFATVAVVERAPEGGPLLCIGQARGEIRRFVMDPERPRVRRVADTGERVNDVIRVRTRAEGPDAPVLAGALLAGAARPR